MLVNFQCDILKNCGKDERWSVFCWARQYILGSYLTCVLQTARISNVEIVLYGERIKTSNMNLVTGLAVHESSVAQVDRAPVRCLGGHRLESCRGLRFFLCPTLVTCWLFHFHLKHCCTNRDSLKYTPWNMNCQNPHCVHVYWKSIKENILLIWPNDLWLLSGGLIQLNFWVFWCNFTLQCAQTYLQLGNHLNTWLRSKVNNDTICFVTRETQKRRHLTTTTRILFAFVLLFKFVNAAEY